MGFLSIQSITPPGVVLPFAGSSAPSGWLICQGQSLSTSAFPALFAAIGYIYGGSGSTFNLPDTRGLFLRGAGTNPDNINNTTTLGARQEDMFKSHSHKSGDWYNNGENGSGIGYMGVNFNKDTGSTGGTETRPANLGVNYIIKI
jgi:microcystin-dependent protein